MYEDLILAGFSGGVGALIDYLSAHVLTCLIPAFFIAGAINALLNKDAITKYLGEKSPAYKAYPVAVIGGLLLAVCSCTILPLFAGIKKKGAGIGPAIAFLYTAPATNILAVAFTWSVIGSDFAIARIVLSIIFAVMIGLIISKLFAEAPTEVPVPIACACAPSAEAAAKSQKHVVLFIATLVAILFAGTWAIFMENRLFEIPLRFIVLPLLVLLLAIEAVKWFTKDEQRAWLEETWSFMKKIFPLLFIGIFAAGAISALLPKDFLGLYLGSNTVAANLIAVLFGTFMYFPTLVEVPMAKMFLDLGMAKGPLLAYVLADPVISLPSILVVRKFMGTKQTIAYVLLIVFFCTLAGLIYGSFAG
ncbi:MAG: putative permease [Methanoregula sp. PtaU1.Bin006]|uniref:permease n=1 Tax=Methanoregula sp. PtaU1.Bin006 TaxID=1811681 RepID=UPI0009C7E0CB|nr:permease [Methanoregula sp. PtaU1.Bin006]OPY32866.1 MAG: putative permease [Methanoregula sp. PtaU1.Bin006]